MGCLFSSSSAAPEPKQRQRVVIPETPTQSTTSFDAATPNMALPSNKSAAGRANSNIVSSYAFGTSVTDRRTLEQDNFSKVVNQAKDAFIDVNLQSCVQVTALSESAQLRASKFEQEIAAKQIGNIPNGFFESYLPQTALTSSQQDIDFILSPIDTSATELSAACAAEACLALGEACIPISNIALVISLGDFEHA